jgi:hypothetical protein
MVCLVPIQFLLLMPMKTLQKVSKYPAKTHLFTCVESTSEYPSLYPTCRINCLQSRERSIQKLINLGIKDMTPPTTPFFRLPLVCQVSILVPDIFGAPLNQNQGPLTLGPTFIYNHWRSYKSFCFYGKKVSPW